MGQRRLAVLAGVLAALYGAVGFLWVRSYDRGGALGWVGETAQWSVSTSEGSLMVARQTPPNPRKAVGLYHNDFPLPYRERPLWNIAKTYHEAAGLELYEFDRGTWRADAVAVPYWWALLAVSLAALWVGRSAHRHRFQRASAGLCVACGYDLRASPERCPECGQSVVRPDRSGAAPSGGGRPRVQFFLALFRRGSR